MAVRTDSTSVQGVLMDDYGSGKDLTGFILTASRIIDRVATCASNKGKTLDSEELELLERWLAAHLYCQSDQPYSSKSTSRASGSFQGQTGMMLDSTKYGQTAKLLDSSGCLTTLEKRQVVSLDWLGKTTSEQIDRTQRD